MGGRTCNTACHCANTPRIKNILSTQSSLLLAHTHHSQHSTLRDALGVFVVQPPPEPSQVHAIKIGRQHLLVALIMPRPHCLEHRIFFFQSQHRDPADDQAFVDSGRAPSVERVLHAVEHRRRASNLETAAARRTGE